MLSSQLPPRTPSPPPGAPLPAQRQALGLHDRDKTPRYRRSTSPSPSPWRPRNVQPPGSCFALQSVIGVTPKTNGKATTRKQKRSCDQDEVLLVKLAEDASLFAPCLAPRPRSVTMKRAGSNIAELSSPESDGSAAITFPSSMGLGSSSPNSSPPKAQPDERSSQTSPPPQLAAALGITSPARNATVTCSDREIEALRAGLQSAFNLSTAPSPTSPSSRQKQHPPSTFANRHQRAIWQRSTRLHQSPYLAAQSADGVDPDGGATSSGVASVSNPSSPIRTRPAFIRRASLNQVDSASKPSHPPAKAPHERPPLPPPTHKLSFNIPTESALGLTLPSPPHPSQALPAIMSGGKAYKLPPAFELDSDSSSELEADALLEPRPELSSSKYPCFVPMMPTTSEKGESYSVEAPSPRASIANSCTSSSSLSSAEGSPNVPSLVSSSSPGSGSGSGSDCESQA